MANNYLFIAEILGRNVKVRREQLGISQTDLGFAIGSDKSYISKVEAGKVFPTQFKLMSLAEALNCPIWLLMKENAESTNAEDLVVFIEAKSDRINKLPGRKIDNLKILMDASLEMAD